LAGRHDLRIDWRQWAACLRRLRLILDDRLDAVHVKPVAGFDGAKHETRLLTSRLDPITRIALGRRRGCLAKARIVRFASRHETWIDWRQWAACLRPLRLILHDRLDAVHVKPVTGFEGAKHETRLLTSRLDPITRIALS
jgi:hypothetical protein